MKKYLFLLFLFFTYWSFAIVHTTAPTSDQTISIDRFINSSNKDLEKEWDVDLSFKEKATLWLMKKKLKKAIKKNPELASTNFNFPLKDQAKDEILGMSSFYLFLVSLLGGLFFWGGAIAIAAFAGGLVAFILSCISLSKHKRNPGKYKGRWMPRLVFWLTGVGIILSIISLILVLGSI